MEHPIKRLLLLLNLKRIGFVLGHNCNAHEEIFSQLSSILIEEFCSCQTEPKIDVCPRASQNTKQYNSWTTNHEKLWMICDLLALRPISHITQKTLSFLLSTKIEQITKTMVIFKTGAIFLYCILFDPWPIPPQTSVQQLAHTRNVTAWCSLIVFPFPRNVRETLWLVVMLMPRGK